MVFQKEAKTQILLLDDDRFYGVLFQKSISKMAHCDAVLSEKDFLRKLSSQTYDLALVDYHLKDSNSLNMIKMIDEIDHTPIILISSTYLDLLSMQSEWECLNSVIGAMCKWEEPQLIFNNSLRLAGLKAV